MTERAVPRPGSPPGGVRSPSARPSRRTVIAAGAASPAGATAGSEVELDPIRWLVGHTTQGFLLEELALARSLGWDGWLEYQLDHRAIPDDEVQARLASFTTLTMSAAEIHDTFVVSGSNFHAARELRAAALMRSVYSRRQLFERVVEFFTDHFSIDQMNFQDRWLKTVDDRDVIRKHALGSFPAMLRASAHSAAMLYFLNNDVNVAAAPNENYARELLELHTVGVDGGYTEQDVKEVARALTGWTFWPKGHPQHGDFRFDATVHDTGPKTVMGLYVPAGGGLEDGDMVLDYLALHPQTAQYVCGKLARWLLMYEPPQWVVDGAAQAYLASGGDVQEVIRAILARDVVEASGALGARKLKRPFQFAVGMLRSSRTEIVDAQMFLDELHLLGNSPYAWPQPNGLPDTVEHWAGSLLPRWILASRYFQDQVEGISFSIQQTFSQLGGFDRTRAGRQLNEVFAGGGLSAADEAALQAFFDAHTSIDPVVLGEGLALAVSSPSFQEY